MKIEPTPLFLVITKHLFNRQLSKDLLMYYSYNEGSYTRVNKLTLKIKDLHFKFLNTFKLTETKKYAFLINDIFLKALYEVSPILKNFVSVLNSLELSNTIKHNGCVKLSSEIMSGSYTDFKSEVSRISVASGARVNVKQLGSIDHRKLLRSTIANFVHSKDSALLHGVVLECKKLGIPLTVIHDNFIIPEKYQEVVKKLYFDMFITRVINTEFSLEYFLSLNKVPCSPETIEFLNSIKINKININKELGSSLVPSSFILC